MRSLIQNASSQPVRNLNQNPQGRTNGSSWTNRWFGAGGAGTHTFDLADTKPGPPFTTRFARKTWTTAPTVNSDTGFQVSSVLPAMPGQKIALGGWLRPSTAKKGFARIQYRLGTTIVTTANGTQIDLPAGVWTYVELLSTVPAGVDGFIQMIDVTGATGTPVWAVGDTLDCTGVMCVLGSRAPQFGDGSTPGWKWDSAADASSSVGYPYTLGSLVAQPIILFEGAFPADVPIPAASQKVRGYTLYAVAKVGAGTTRDTLVDGTSVNQRIHITYGDGGQRWNHYQSQSSFTGVVNDANTRRVISARFDGGGSRFLRDGVQASAASTGQAPQAVTALRIGRNAAGGDPWSGTIEAVLLFDQAHTNEQMLAVTRWLGLRYGQAFA